jgi:predicted esterase
LLFCRCLSAQAPAPTFPVGTIIPKVTSSADEKQSYALYLPSSFSAGRAWPIIYVFDPVARGRVAAEVIRAAAEKYGYIVAASNNSRNGPMEVASAAARAMWQDTQQKLPLDDRRYFAGMSGGARVAVSLALSCKNCVAGVIANAAGFPLEAGPSREMNFAYFVAAGNADLNYPEIMQLRGKLDEAGARYHVRIFEGNHGWAPSEVWLEALNWMDIQAMAAGALPRDQARIDRTVDDEMGKARALETKKDMLGALREYQSVTRNFHGLADVSAAKERLAALEKDKAVKAGEKQEKSDMAEQARLTSEFSASMKAIASGDLSLVELTELKGKIADMKRKAAGPSEGADRHTMVLRRALSELIVWAYESGQSRLEGKDSQRALLYFDLAATGSQNPAWAHFQRARTYAMASNKKNMLAELGLCSEQGFHDVSALDATEFDAYRGQAEFQAVVTEWKKQAQP